MTPQELPELPEAALMTALGRDAYTANQMHQYARDYAAALAGAGAVAYITPSALDVLNKCRNDDHNGVVEVWMRPFDELGATIPVFTHPAPVAGVTDEMVEAACSCFYGDDWTCDADEGANKVINDGARSDMRAALTAALEAKK